MNILKNEQRWIVLKFGGNSVTDLTCWQTIINIVRAKIVQGLRPLVVCSALSGITDKLSALCEKNSEREKILAEIIFNYTQLTLILKLTLAPHSLFAGLTDLLYSCPIEKTASPGIKAKIIAFGEIILTMIGAEFFKVQGIDTAWYDARSLLRSVEEKIVPAEVRYLSALCDWVSDHNLQKKLDAVPGTVILTQGFIASNLQGETVLLGRGGSDTSAAYFAAKLGATRCEIWTDVLGVYSADPNEVPEARLLTALDYEEAQEISSMGGKVLHSRSIFPVKMHGIPLYVACTRKAEHKGTEITSRKIEQNTTPIKSILIKRGIRLIKIETLLICKQNSFLADIFTLFRKYHISIDLVSTSRSAVTISFDLQINGQGQQSVDSLLSELNIFCRASEISHAAIISIIGKNIRSMLHYIGSALKVFEGHKVYLISQAANDLNISIVVDEAHVRSLARQLHNILIEKNVAYRIFEKSCLDEFLPVYRSTVTTK